MRKVKLTLAGSTYYRDDRGAWWGARADNADGSVEWSEPVLEPTTVDRLRSEVRRIKARRARVGRQAAEGIMREMGLVKVKGALGGVYWE
jgi:hypothetical protein